MADTMRALRSTITDAGKLELTVVDVARPEPGPGDVLIEVGASPINPSDLGSFFGPADMSTATSVGTPESPMVVADVPANMMRMAGPRVGKALAIGNEGAGMVVAAGADAAAQALMGKIVAVIGGGMYSQYKVAPADQCLVLPDGITAEEAASCFVNPLTVLGMVETMRLEGHSAIVHTAAASNLGQMLQKVCVNEGVALVNIVRRQEHVELLRGLGATHVVDSSKDSFMADLIDACAETGATVGFDATGGGSLGGNILTAMEVALTRKGSGMGAYGSTTHKQVYLYGGLDRTPTTFTRSFGMAWGMGGWLLPPFLARVGAEKAQELREKVASEIKTTFVSGYSARVSLDDALSLESIAHFGRMATGEKFLVCPSL